MFNFFEAIINGIVFDILSQFVHCSCTERLLIFVSLLYPATMLKLFMVSRRFWMELFWVFEV
jgi:hypothetical protein